MQSVAEKEKVRVVAHQILQPAELYSMHCRAGYEKMCIYDIEITEPY